MDVKLFLIHKPEITMKTLILILILILIFLLFVVEYPVLKTGISPC